MRTLSLTLALTLLSSAHAQLDLGLLGHWTFTASSTVDLSGQNNNGSIFGEVLPTTDRGGASDCALLFPGDGSHVYIPYSADLDRAPSDAFTISLWYQGGSPEVGDLEWLFSKRNPGSGWNATNYALCLYDLNRVLCLAGNTGSLWSPIEPPIPDTQWHNLAYIYANGYQQVWLDNQLVIADPLQQHFVTQSNHGVTIGENFSGAMDDIRFYDRALSPQEVDLLFQETSSCSTNGLAEQTAAAFLVMPNPATDVLTVQVQNATGLLELFDATGRSVQRITVRGTTSTLDLGHLNSGLYLLRYSNGSEAVVQRIIKR